MAHAIWSGRCSLIHKLAPDKYPARSDSDFKVPDLFALFEYLGRSYPVLVEVKSHYRAPKPGAVLRLRTLSHRYRQRLRNYGDLVGLPVLIAQQILPVGLWFLVALESVPDKPGKIAPEVRNDLMGPLLGTFSIAFRKGTKLVSVIEAEEEIPVDTREVTGVMTEAYWESADGQHIQRTASPMMLLFGLGDPQGKTKFEGRKMTQEWEILADWSFFT